MSQLMSVQPRILITFILKRICRHSSSQNIRMWVRNHGRKLCVDKEMVVQTLRGWSMRVSPRDYASYGIFFFGDYDPRMTEVISRCLKPGATAWDIGTDRGWFTLLMADTVGSSGRVDSFEAFPPNADKLKDNISLNGYNCVTVNNVAVSDENGECWFKPPSEEITGECDYLECCSGIGYLVDKETADTIRVSTITLDDYADQVNTIRLDLIKIDIEGAEVQALRGAKKIIQRFKPIIAIEYNRATLNRTNSNMDELDSLLEEYGYDRYFFRTSFTQLNIRDWDNKPDNESVFNVYCFPHGTDPNEL